MTSNRHFIIILTLLLLCAALVLTIARRGEPVVVKTNLENLPMQLTGYQGEKDSFSQAVYDTLDADVHVYRHYFSADNFQLSFYLGYYGTAKGGRTSHNPYGCLPGSGWGLVDAGIIQVFPSYYPKGVDVNYIIAAKNGTKNVMLYWYQAAGSKILATGLQQNITRFLGRVLYNRNDGAYVQVNAFASEDKIPQVKEKVAAFVQVMMEELPHYWPDEK